MNEDSPPIPGSFREFHTKLGGIPLDRILMKPPPGTATEEDLIAAWEGPEQHWCELVDGTLINRFGTFRSGILVAHLGYRLGSFIQDDDLGVVLNAKCPIRLKPGLIRCPSLSFTPWETFPGEELPGEQVGSYIPDLWVDLQTRWNTPAEMERKVEEYFSAGVKLVWVIDTEAETAAVHPSADRCIAIDLEGDLDGGKVLPGFKLPLADLFAATKRRKKK